MACKNPFQREFERLDRIRNTSDGNFAIRYGFRNPRTGIGLGSSGVNSEEIVDRYDRALQKAFQYFRDRSWISPKTQKRHNHRIPVYVHDVRLIFSIDCPFTYTSRGGSMIGLRCENGEPTLAAMLERAEIEAAHEVSHVFAHRHRSPTEKGNDTWQWFDEATAYFAEREIFPDHAESLRFSSHWCRCPEDSLDDLARPGGNGRSARWFVQYLVKHYGDDFLRDVWHSGTPTEIPLQTISRLLQKQQPGLDSVACLDQLFGSAYAIESYFENILNDGVMRRFGARSITESFEVPPTMAPIARDATLAPAACRYYRFLVPQRGTTLSVKLFVEQAVLQAALREAKDLRAISAAIPLQKNIGEGTLAGQITSSQDDSAIILTVANTDLLRSLHSLPSSETPFRLHVEAV